MSAELLTLRSLPDPDLVAQVIAHRKQQIQVTIDFMQAEYQAGVQGSEPFTALKDMRQEHPSFKSTFVDTSA